MKNLKNILLLSFLCVFSVSVLATDYVVSGAGSNAVNGTYSQDGTYNGKAKYKYDNNGTIYYLYFTDDGWGWEYYWVISSTLSTPFNYSNSFYYNDDSGDTPPENGWYKASNGSDPVPIVLQGYTLLYQPETFTESSDNDGTMGNSITITFVGAGSDYFTGSTGVFASDKYTASNVPAGLNMVITKNSNTELSVSLEGIASSHDHINDISDLGIEFNNNAFNLGNASAVNGYSKSDLSVNFRDQINVASSGGDYTTIAAAILAANSGDIINISAETYTEYDLYNGTKDLIIQGQGAGSTIIQAHASPQSAPNYHVFKIYNASVTIKNLTIRHGYFLSGVGGGIYCSSDEELVLRNVTISDNYASDEGGAIYKNAGTLTIENCLINDNISSGYRGGGGLYATNTTIVTINNSTFSGNRDNDAYRGGAMSLGDVNVTITNSTLTANRRGIYIVDNDCDLTISNSILADNDMFGEYEYDYEIKSGISSNTLNDNGYNIVERSNDYSDFTGTGTYVYTNKGNGIDWYRYNGSSWVQQTGISLNLSSTLADNNTIYGTQTLALGLGSFAIDNGTGTANDQRGVPVSGNKDIGAYETNANWVVWEGGTSSVWGTGTNWSSGSTPGSTADIGINMSCDHYPSLTSAISCQNLTVSNEADFTIEDNGSLTTSSNLTNEGTFTIQSNADGTGSLIVEGDLSNSGTMTAQRHITGNSLDWHLLSSPVSSQEIGGNFTDANGYDFFMYYEPENWWVNKKNTTTSPTWSEANGSNIFVPGRGYMVAYTDPNTNAKAFSGTFNQGTVSIAVSNTVSNSYSGSNLIGNPYPSSIDWKAASGWTRNMLSNDGGGYTMYIYNQANNNYGSFISNGSSGTNGVTQYIAPMQGFFVNAASSGTLQMTEDVCVHQDASWLKNDKLESSVIRMNVSNAQFGADEVVLEQNAEKAGGAEKWFSMEEKAPSLWVEQDDDQYSILLCSSTQQKEVYDIGFIAGAEGEYRIKAEFDVEEYPGLSLEDTKENIFHELAQGDYYFIAGLNDEEARFKLHLSTTGLEEMQSTAFYAYQYGDDIIIKSETAIDRIILTDITGKTLGIYQNTSSVPAPKTAGVYLLSIMLDDQQITKKITIQQ